jgi:UPF0755 protein
MSQLGLDTPTEERTRRRRRRGGWRSALAVLIALMVIVGGLGGALYVGASFLGSRLNSPAADYEGTGSGTVQVEVEPGETATDIAATLQEAGVVRSAEAFAEVAADDDRSVGIQPGFYALREEMSARSALDLLLEPASRLETNVAVPEGSRLSEIVTLVAQNTRFTKKAVTEALGKGGNNKALGLPPYAGGDPEGYLFPATYPVDPGTSEEELAAAMVARFTQAADGLELEERARRLGITPGEAVVIASLVEGEARLDKDYAKVARVVYNRLEADMALQFDSTVNYALDADKERVRQDDLEVDSPYNTYLHTGLPPGPINSPGEAAMEAALSPAEGDWLYFVTVDLEKGTTKFATSYDEFLELKRELAANRG